MRNHVLLKDWSEKWDQPEERDRLSNVHERLTIRYNEPHRYYHTLDHIAACLDEFSRAENLIPHSFEVWLAIWFHDVVYDPKAHDNEERSIEYARKALEGIACDNALDRVSRLIMVTKHDIPARENDEKFIADIDLAILGRERNIFDDYEKGVRLEYAWVPDDRFSKGRLDLLVGFLERDSIYQTDYFRGKYEEKARANLRLSIKMLEKGG